MGRLVYRAARVTWLADAGEGMKLSGDRNQCQGCKAYFNSTAAFDKHRVGTFGAPIGDGTYMAHTRRCRTPEEMAAAGMSKNAADFWITAANPMFSKAPA